MHRETALWLTLGVGVGYWIARRYSSEKSVVNVSKDEIVAEVLSEHDRRMAETRMEAAKRRGMVR